MLGKKWKERKSWSNSKIGKSWTKTNQKHFCCFILTKDRIDRKVLGKTARTKNEQVKRDARESCEKKMYWCFYQIWMIKLV